MRTLLKGQQMYNKTTRTGGADTCPITFWGCAGTLLTDRALL